VLKRIADTGLIVALLNRRDPFHRWALAAFTEHARFFTCDAVVTGVLPKS
jgi:predicted nucleic acid-binding protein